MYYIHKDYLGSFETITDNNGQVLEKLSFDPCLSAVTLVKAEGRRRNPTDWTYDNVPTSFLFDRGFTGHEHLDNFDLVNMPARRSNSGGGNGRVYDPWLGRMLSPDPFLQAPGNSQSYNRYSYAYNNPLKYTDPSGYTERLSIVPGSGNHWSDPFRGEYGNYMLMSRNTFNNYYGAGSTDIVEQIWLNPDALKKWKQGELTLEQIRDDGGFEVDYSITYESDWPFNNGNKTLPVIERISKWVSVGSAGGGNDPYQNSHGEPIYSMDEFINSNQGLTRSEIINQRQDRSKTFLGSQPGGPDMRYVRNPHDGRVLDMRHMLVVGNQPAAAGNLLEVFQWGTGQASGMDPQDFYSNGVGYQFYMQSSSIQRLIAPTSFTDQLNSFFSNPRVMYNW